MTLPDDQTLDQPFTPSTDAAEYHGLLCGMLCADPNLNAETWLATTYDAPQHQQQAHTTNGLHTLFAVTAQQFTHDPFELRLLLPSDEHALHERIAALGAWCQGFLSGMGLGGLQSLDALDTELREFIHDVNQIARIGGDTEYHEGDEGDEEAYTEIVEYIRVGVLLLHQSQRHTLTVHPHLH